MLHIKNWPLPRDAHGDPVTFPVTWNFTSGNCGPPVNEKDRFHYPHLLWNLSSSFFSRMKLEITFFRVFMCIYILLSDIFIQCLREF